MTRALLAVLMLFSVLFTPGGVADVSVVCVTQPEPAIYNVLELEEKGATGVEGRVYLWSERNAANRDEVVVFTVYYHNYGDYWGVEERASCTYGDCIYDHVFEGTSLEELLACLEDAATG